MERKRKTIDPDRLINVIKDNTQISRVNPAKELTYSSNNDLSKDFIIRIELLDYLPYR